MNEREFADRRGGRDVRSIGPFDHFDVTVNGFTVPFLQAENRGSTEVTLHLDRRFAIDLPQDLAGQVIEFLADAIAVAMGYSCHPREGWTPENAVAPHLNRRHLPWTNPVGIGDVDE